MAGILLVDDDTDFSSAMCALLEAEGHDVSTADSLMEAKRLLSRGSFEFLFVDLSLPDGSGLKLIQDGGPRTVIITGHPSVNSAIRAVRGPVIDYLVKPVDKAQLLACIEKSDKQQATSRQTAKPTKTSGDSPIIGESKAMKDLLKMVSDFGPTDEPILIMGESGTGKDLIARLIHDMRQSGGSFVPLNCGAIPRELIASELFGHVKGSFTGATGKRKGVFERAEKGTVFLDEVGELPLDHQVALLRVLENRSILPVGGDKEVSIDVKIVAATNRDLDKQVRDGKFREDLFFRLMVLPIDVPPLREREGDVELLARHFLGEYAVTHGSPTELEPKALEAIKRYAWPGNVRELKHAMLRMAILNRGKKQIEQIPDTFDRPLELSADQSDFKPGMSIKDVEKTLIEKTLDHFDGNKTQTAEALGISLKTLYNRLSEYGHQTDD